MTMNRRTLSLSLGALLAAAALLPVAANAADLSATDFVQQVSGEVLSAIKADPAMMRGDIAKIMVLVDQKVVPNVDFARMTGSAVGPQWRSATPEQKAQLQASFKTLLVRTYAGAFKMAGDKNIKVLPVRADAAAQDLVVRSQLVGSGEPVVLEYRLSKTPGQGLGWKAYNVNVAGSWMISAYNQQFKPIVDAKGIDGLITALQAQNKANAAADR